MNIFHELGRLQIAAREAEPFDQYRGILDDDASERIGGMRRVLMMDQARRRQAVGLDLQRRMDRMGDRKREFMDVMVHGRQVSVPAAALAVLRVLEAANEQPMTRAQISEAAFGTPHRADAVTQRCDVLEMAFRFQDCGLGLHRNSRVGITLLAEPLTLAQSQEARAVS